jgi:predicted nucleic acid-binding Zn ribbon protein
MARTPAAPVVRTPAELPEFVIPNVMRPYVKRSKDPALVNSFLEGVLRKFGLEKEIRKYQFVLLWKDIVGEEIAKRTKPSGFNGQSLMVFVENSSWAQELAFHKNVILTRLRRHFGDSQPVRDIIFQVGKIR